MQKNIIFIKLGGSIITDKDKPKTANLEKIRQLAQELAQASKRTATRIILGHGGGSFPHPPAHKYQTHLGFINKDSAYGLAEVRQACLELNLIIISALLKVGLPAVSLAPFNFLTAKNKRVDKVFLPPLLNMLNFNILPVIYGDVVSDSSIGSTIYSTETILNLLATKLPKFGYQPQFMIEIGKTEGVIDGNGRTIPEINNHNFKAIKSQLTGSESTDVTGGMLHKVQEAYTLAKKGVSTLIISSKQGNLKKAILGQKIAGTWIK